MDLDNGEDEVTTSLADDLSAALDEQTQGQETEPQETAEQKQAREYARDEAGRFAAKQAEEQAPAQTPEQQAQAQAPKAWRPNWYKDEYGDWSKLPETFRNALRDQERAAQQGIEKHSTAAKQWEPLAEVLKPYEQQLRAQGQTPQQFVGGLVNIYGYLQSDPVQALNWLAQNTLGPGWDIRQLADWMDQQGVQAQKIDPVQQELQALKQQMQQLSQYPQRQASEAVSRQITDWSRDKPDFDAVRQTMAAIAKQNPEASLDQLYEQARWAHPETRERLLNEREDKRRAELQGKRQAAATSPRTGVNGSAAQSKPTMSLQDELAARLDGTI
jgi:hypothetical protein